MAQRIGRAGLAACVVLAAALTPGRPAMADNVIRIEPQEPYGRISPMIYGQFLEHIYDSVVDGLWGQRLRAPCFEEPPDQPGEGWQVKQGSWHVSDGELIGEGSGADNHLFTGDPGWQDIEISLKARKDSGAEGFLILFRALDENNFYWWNLGGWGNTRSSVEQEVDGVRSSVPGTQTPHTIHSGRWYDIRIVPLVQCWLDGEKVTEFRDQTNGRGRIGLGNWHTTVRYRDLKVTGGGQTLFTMDTLPPANTVSRFWKAFPEHDPPRTRWTGHRPLESLRCQEVTALRAGQGILQTGVPVETGAPLTGSVWLRGSAPSVTVSLENCDASPPVTLKLSGTEWKEYPFRFTAGKTTADAVFRLTLDGPGTVWVDLCTLEREDTPWRPSIFEKVRDIRPAFIRWPGGCYAEYYRWRDGVGPRRWRVTKPNYSWGGLDPNHFGTDEFIRLCRELGAEPVIVLNVGHHDTPEREPDYIREALDWVEYCNGSSDTPMGALRAANGHPEPYNVRCWEIGNETWPIGVEAYAARAVRFVDALRAKDPSLKFLLCGSGGHDLEWNRRMLELAATHMDYLSVHHYMQGSFEEEMRDAVAYAQFCRATGELIAASVNPAIKIAVTEWNQQSTALRTGLYAGMLLNGFERLSDVVEMSCPALFIRKTDAPAWDNAFINHDSLNVFTAPNYLVMKLYRENFAPERLRCDAPEGLNAVATRDPASGGIILKVVNPSASEEARARIEIGGGFPCGPAKAWQVWSPAIDDRNSLQEPEKIRIREIPAASEMVFPAHSVTVMRFASGKQ
jgi:alpha-N-arabinofuranosidase